MISIRYMNHSIRKHPEAQWCLNGDQKTNISNKHENMAGCSDNLHVSDLVASTKPLQPNITQNGSPQQKKKQETTPNKLPSFENVSFPYFFPPKMLRCMVNYGKPPNGLAHLKRCSPRDHDFALLQQHRNRFAQINWIANASGCHCFLRNAFGKCSGECDQKISMKEVFIRLLKKEWCSSWLPTVLCQLQGWSTGDRDR